MPRPPMPGGDVIARTADAALGPVIRNTVQEVNKRLYPYLTRRVSDDVFFLNWGYEEDPPMDIPLDAADEPHRYPIQLYHSTASQGAGLAGKRVLEVGCGHGGGASYLARTLNPASYTGLDLNPAGIEYCRRNHKVPGLEFVQGNAENLPFPAASFDAVVNVESSHCYPHFDRFLAEVERVLRPGGEFLYTDVRQRTECEKWEAALKAAAGLQLVSGREINTEVIRALELNPTPWGAQVMDRLVPKFLRGLARKGAPERESWIHRDLVSGKMSYRMYLLVKS
ncbi:phthiotriol/phenolphthiotriol dimycocerosates methyltransferase [Mycolicibacterium phlei]